MKKNSLKAKLMAIVLTFCMVIVFLPTTVYAADPTVIDRIVFTYEDPKYNAGDSPRKLASITAEGAHYTIYDECIAEMKVVKEKPGEPDVIVPTGRYWHSNPIEMVRIASEKRIASMEAGKIYLYSVVFQPKSSGYKFDKDTTEVFVDNRSWGTPAEGAYLKMVDSGLRIEYTHYGTVYVVGGGEEQAITSAAVENVKLDYKDGEAPRASARRAGVNQDKYDILYESWGKLEKTDEVTTETVAYWYSDEDYFPAGYPHITAFDKEGKYEYSVRLKARDGYTFGDSISADDITINGKSLPEGSFVMLMDDNKTCLVTYGMTMRTIRPVKDIKLNGPTVDFFIDGDEPRFTGYCNSAFYDIDHQLWEENDNSGIGITSSESWNKNYEQLITNFEYGKTYNYGVYFNITDLGLEEGYRFDKNTKLYINDEEINLSSDQIKVYSDGKVIQFKNVLSMTPEAPWQKIDLIEIEGATVTFKDGDKPVFTGKTPEDAPYIYQFECWETKDGAGVNSAEFFDKAYEKHITAFKNGETYQYILYFKAEHGYYFTADTKIKINGTFYNYRLVNIDPDFDSTGKMYTFWAYTDLNMTPLKSEITPEYKIIEGANGAWTQNSDGTLTFRANGDFSRFTGVKVDGITISDDKYTAASGSTVVTLKKDYLSTLSVGKHTLTVIYNDGKCSTNFVIKAVAGQGSSQPRTEKIAKTSDSNSAVTFAALMLITGMGSAYTASARKKYK